MGSDDFLLIGVFAVQTAIYVSAPCLLLGLVAGFIISVFQASTQINDASLAFIPKICAALMGIVVFGNFMINRLAAFTTWVYSQIAQLSP